MQMYWYDEFERFPAKRSAFSLGWCHIKTPVALLNQKIGCFFFCWGTLRMNKQLKGVFEMHTTERLHISRKFLEVNELEIWGVSTLYITTFPPDPSKMNAVSAHFKRFP